MNPFYRHLFLGLGGVALILSALYGPMFLAVAVLSDDWLIQWWGIGTLAVLIAWAGLGVGIGAHMIARAVTNEIERGHDQ